MWENSEQINNILKNINIIENRLSDMTLNCQNNIKFNEMISDMEFCFKMVNNEIYGTEYIAKNKALEYCEKLLKEEISTETYILEVDKWRELILDTINFRNKLKNKVDYEFFQYIDYIEMVDKTVLIEKGIEGFNIIRRHNDKDYYAMINFYNNFCHFWGKVDIENNIFDLFEEKAKALKEHREDLVWLYNQLDDYRSKFVLTGIIKFWSSFDISAKRKVIENNFNDYYDFDLINCDENEVFVDIGAYDGDSIKSFIDSYNKYKKIYAYEITPSSVLKLKENLKEYDNIEIRNKAVSLKNGTMYLKSNLYDSSNRINKEGDIPIEMVSIDEDIKEKITFIKMDIEGAEQEALKGCRNHIIKDKPKLAICTYHNNEDIWKIPRMIKEMNPQYKLYMRYNGSEYGFAASEFVIFAIDNN